MAYLHNFGYNVIRLGDALNALFYCIIPSTHSMVKSLHIIGSKQFGGAENFYVRLVCALNDIGYLSLAVNRPKSLVSVAFDDKAKQIHVPMRNTWDIFSVLTIRRLIAKIKPEIVQTYMGRATRLTRLPPKSDTIHVSRLGGYYKIKGYYDHAHAWVGNTQGICDYLTQQGMPAKRIYLIGNFVEANSPQTFKTRFNLRHSLNIPKEAIIIFSLGRFIEKKGFNDLLVSFSHIPDEINGRKLFLVLAGDGPLNKKLQVHAMDLEIDARVRWLGWQNDPDPYYDFSDIFVCPSRHEPLGNVILEAWSHHLPVISTKTKGALSLIEDGFNGVLASCNDPDELAVCLKETLKSGQHTWQRLAYNGKKKLLEKHSKEIVVKAYMEMYKELQNMSF